MVLYPVAFCSQLRRSRRINNESFLFFPDDLLIEILSWLSAKDVLRSRCVCRKWKDLTSNKDFTDLHIRRSIPMILMKYYKTLVMVDRCWEPARKSPDIQELYPPNAANNGLSVKGQTVFSHNGLIVTYGYNKGGCKYPKDVVIYNPIYRDAVHIIRPFSMNRSEVCGVFYHPLHKEYCTLWGINDTESLQVQYKILNLGSNPKWRDIKNPCNRNARLNIDPVLIGTYLYWMVEPYQHYNMSHNLSFNCDIIEYDISNEEFRLIPCPVDVTVYNRDYNVNLVDSGGGVISLVQVFPSKEMVKITMWTLKGHGEQLWTSCNYVINSDVYSGYGVPKGVAFWNGDLVLESDGRLYVCNLKLNLHSKKTRQFQELTFVLKYNLIVSFSSHVTSLVSLRNCKSEILMMAEEDANYERESCNIM